MSWNDHEAPRPRRVPSASAAEAPQNVLLALAGKYRLAAGRAYSEGRDDDAAKYRKASEDLSDAALALPDLPALPVVTR